MMKFQAEKVVRVSGNLRQFAECSAVKPDPERVEKGISYHDRQSLIDRFKEVESLISDCGLDVSLVAIRQFSGELSASKRIKYKDVATSITGLLDYIDNELSTKFVFSLNAKEASFYANPLTEWSAAIKRFDPANDIRNDIEECLKCYALGRYAASVFHSLQVVESGVIHLGYFLSHNDKKCGFTATANELKRICCVKPEQNLWNRCTGQLKP